MVRISAWRVCACALILGTLWGPCVTTLRGELVAVEGGMLPEVSRIGALNVSSFLIGRYEVTWGQWQEIRAWGESNGYIWSSMGENPEGMVPSGCEADHPVHSVNWYDILKWCNAMSEREGLTPVYRVNGEIFRQGEPGNRIWDDVTGAWIFIEISAVEWDRNANGYRLPDEAEWEFAARGGRQSGGYRYSGSNDLDAVGWYWDNSTASECNLWTGLGDGRGTLPVGLKAANELGLHDMTGNVWEWTWDRCNERCLDRNGAVAADRILRGGSWYVTAQGCAISYRISLFPDFRGINFGFRLARNAGQ